eukprot:2121512-Pleurochrysis_carterae.AAC.1
MRRLHSVCRFGWPLLCGWRVRVPRHAYTGYCTDSRENAFCVTFMNCVLWEHAHGGILPFCCFKGEFEVHAFGLHCVSATCAQQSELESVLNELNERRCLAPSSELRGVQHRPDSTFTVVV